MKAIDILAIIMAIVVIVGISSCCIRYSNNIDRLMKSYQEELGC